MCTSFRHILWALFRYIKGIGFHWVAVNFSRTWKASAKFGRTARNLPLSHTANSSTFLEEVRSFSMRCLHLGAAYYIERAIALREGLLEYPCACTRCRGARIWKVQTMARHHKAVGRNPFLSYPVLVSSCSRYYHSVSSIKIYNHRLPHELFPKEFPLSHDKIS